MSLTRFENDLFDNFFGDWKGSMPNDLVNIKVDVKENQDSFLIHAEIPGVPKDQIKVEHFGNKLRISGEIKNEKDEKDEKHHLKERRFGKFERQFSLPKTANLDLIQAKHENGIVNITIPKQQVENQKTNVVKIE